MLYPPPHITDMWPHDCTVHNKYSVIIEINFLQTFTACLEASLRKKTILRTDSSVLMNERYYTSNDVRR